MNRDDMKHIVRARLGVLPEQTRREQLENRALLVVVVVCVVAILAIFATAGGLL